MTERRAAPVDDDTAHLEDQREFLLASLEDLEREHDAGDLGDDDYATLKADYTARAARALRAEQAAAIEAPTARPRDRGRTVAVIAGVAAFALLAGFLVARSLGARGEGDSLSGGIGVEQSPNQRAQRCQALINQTAPTPALECFAAVLADDPRNAVAKTWSAWQLELTAQFLPEGSAELTEVRSRVEALLAEAVEVNPRYSYARAFQAVVAYRHGDPAAAERYLAEFEANDPSTDARAVIEQMGLEDSIEAALAEGTTTTTTTPG